MRLQVITQPADTIALLRHLSGRYSPTKGARAFYWATACLFCIAGVSLAWRLSSWSPQSADSPWVLALAVLLAFVFTAVMAVNATTAYVFTTDAIEHVAPLRHLSQRMAASDVRDAYITLDRSLVLRFRDVRDKQLAVPIDGRLREVISTLYPEVGRDPQVTAPVLSSRYRLPIWISVATLLLVVVFVALFLERRGLLIW